MSLLHERSPVVGILPIPPFANQATVIQALPYPSPQGGYPLALLGFYTRNLRVISMAWWAQGNISSTTALRRKVYWRTNLFSRDRIAVPNGAAWWALSAPAPPPRPGFALDVSELFRVRWELHV